MDEEDTKLPGRQFRVELFGQDAVEHALLGATATLAPWITEMTDRALFEDIWQAEGLSTRDRSMVTVAALTAMGRTNELRAHLSAALRLGITKEQLVQVIGQLTFYAGLPAVHAGLAAARDVFEDEHGAD
ncbi:carboxymuconolactone decarboxylase family protein [Dactylosporangium roseum]|uniref:Carboxymuconolactone decarboxylase family protein n=1 Tax=Dactylosporangium roseum TaxID=47989 RepID=A0ABY5ZCG0_9ACTN|nr:carboxymuconolactone decarboxylase family protein [Dactylosporangium roseum]UWZ39716.1 carboxymuconolactone decarboxylase family protein [Dactylosporangium roseum]